MQTETETSGDCVCVMWRHSCTPHLSSAAHDHRHSAQVGLLVYRSGQKGHFRRVLSEQMLPSSGTQWLFAEFKTGTFGFKRDETWHDRVARLDFRYIKLLVEFCQLKIRIEGLQRRVAALSNVCPLPHNFLQLIGDEKFPSKSNVIAADTVLLDRC